MSKSDNNSLAKNTLWLSIGTFMTKGLAFVMVPLFSRWLTTSQYGTFDIFCTYVSLLIPVIGLATNEAVFRFSVDAEDKQVRNKYITNDFFIFLINSLIALIIITVLFFVVHWDLAFYFYFLLVGEVFNIYLRGFLRGIKKIPIYATSNVVTTLATAIMSTVFILLFKMELKGILLGYAFGYMIGNLIIVFLSHYWCYFSISAFSFKIMLELIKYSYALIPNNLAWWVINVSDRSIINFVLGTAANGIYAIAYKIPNICTAVFGTFGVAWQQTATEVLNQEDREQYYNKVFNRLLLTLLSISIGILSCNSWLFNYIFDERYFEGYLYAPILVIGTIFASLAQFYGGIQISLKRPKDNGVTTVIGAIVNVAVHLALVWFIGLYAASISTLLSQVVVCGLRSQKLKDEFRVKLDRTNRRIAVTFIIYFALSYYIGNMIVNIVSTFVAAVIFILCNKEYLNKIIKKIKK